MRGGSNISLKTFWTNLNTVGEENSSDRPPVDIVLLEVSFRPTPLVEGTNFILSQSGEYFPSRKVFHILIHCAAAHREKMTDCIDWHFTRIPTTNLSNSWFEKRKKMKRGHLDEVFLLHDPFFAE